MKIHRSRFTLLPAAFAALTALAVHGQAAEAGFKSIFNGKNLSGWEGNTAFWSVRDGAITGQTTAANPLKSNTFLIWKGGDVKNFELRLSFRLTGQNDKEFANSGVQYRSRIVDAAAFVVGGYQADMDLTGKYLGMLYEEKGRGILMGPGEKVRVGPIPAGQKKAAVEKLSTVTSTAALAAAYRKGGWNDFVVIAEGNHLRHYLNGVLTADVTDLDEAKGAKAGVLALQLHQGQPMTVEFKDVRLKSLP